MAKMSNQEMISAYRMLLIRDTGFTLDAFDEDQIGLAELALCLEALTQEPSKQLRFARMIELVVACLDSELDFMQLPLNAHHELLELAAALKNAKRGKPSELLAAAIVGSRPITTIEDMFDRGRVVAAYDLLTGLEEYQGDKLGPAEAFSTLKNISGNFKFPASRRTVRDWKKKVQEASAGHLEPFRVGYDDALFQVSCIPFQAALERREMRPEESDRVWLTKMIMARLTANGGGVPNVYAVGEALSWCKANAKGWK